MIEQSPDSVYIERCAQAMQMRYGHPVQVRITRPGNPKLYPRGAWFDELVGATVEPAGVDFDAAPWAYVMPSGERVPHTSAEVVEKEMYKFGPYYIDFRRQPCGFVHPESGDRNTWQLSLGFVVITRMK